MSTRAQELRHALYHIREARASLRAGDVARAFRRHKMAMQGLMYSCGLERNTDATAGLRRILADLGDHIEGAIRPAPLAPTEEVVDLIAEGIRPLQREHPEIEEAELMERSRNIAMGMVGEFEVRVRR